MGPRLFDEPGYTHLVFVTNRTAENAVEIWRDDNGRASVEWRIEELKNEMAADEFCLRAFRATEATFLAVVMAFNLLGEFQRALDGALTRRRAVGPAIKIGQLARTPVRMTMADGPSTALAASAMAGLASPPMFFTRGNPAWNRDFIVTAGRKIFSDHSPFSRLSPAIADR